MLLVHLAQHDECIGALLQNQSRHYNQLLYVVENLHGRGGIHETRANALSERLRGSDDINNDDRGVDNNNASQKHQQDDNFLGKHQDEKKE